MPTRDYNTEVTADSKLNQAIPRLLRTSDDEVLRKVVIDRLSIYGVWSTSAGEGQPVGGGGGGQYRIPSIRWVNVEENALSGEGEREEKTNDQCVLKIELCRGLTILSLGPPLP